MNVNIIGVPRQGQSGLFGTPYMEKELRLLGFPVSEASVRDDVQLEQAFLASAEQQALILCPLTGNRQIDSLCIANAAKVCGKGLIVDQQLLQSIAKRVKITREEAQRLATVPQGAKVFPSRLPASPGFELTGNGQRVIVLPADRMEQSGLFFTYLFPMLAKVSPKQCSCRVIRVMELAIPQLEGALRDLISIENPCVALYEKPGEVIIRVSAQAADRQQAAGQCIITMKEIVKRLGSYVYGIDVNNIEHALSLKCAKRGLKCAIAESAAGNSATRRLAQLSGGKDCILKTWSFQPETMDLTKLGINNKIAQKFGQVSANVAAAMALGASKQAEKDLIGIGITLPDAAVTSPKAYIAAVMGEACLIQELNISDYRSVSRMVEDAVSKAFNLARKFADSYPSPPKDAASAEDAVLQGLAAVPKSTGLKNEIAPVPEKAPAKQEGPNEDAPKGIKRILSAIFPTRGDSGFDKFRKIALLLCVCIFCGSVFYLVDFGAQSKKSQANISSLQQEMEQAEKEAEDGNLSNIEGYPNDYLAKFVSFYKRNEDIKGWLKIPNTNVNFPVVQTSDNDFYHRLGFDKEYDYYGTPYIDYEVDVKKPSTNIIVYGHNIKNDGQMFNDLTKYKKLDFYKANPVVNFDSVYKLGNYKIIGAFITNTEASHDNGNVFEYTHFIQADNEKEFNGFVDEVKKRSIFDAPVDVEYGDSLLTLSTCTYEFKEARFVVVARRIRDGEDESVDVEKAAINEDAYYPAVYAGAAEYAKKLGKVKSIAIQGKKSLSLEVGQTAILSAKVSPSDAPIQSCTWDSNNKKVATVDKNTGLVTAVGAGEATITAVADDGGHVDSATVTVTGSAAAQATGLSLNHSGLSLKPGDTGSLSVTLTPSDAEASLAWKSGDESIVKVTGDNTGAALTAVNAGKTKVTVSTSDGKLSAVCSVTVSETQSASVTSISFAQSSLTMGVGKTQTLKLKASPSGEIPDSVDLTWDGGNILGYTQDDTGLIVTLTAKAEGKGTLTATTDGGLTAACTITIQAEAPDGETGDAADKNQGENKDPDKKQEEPDPSKPSFLTVADLTLKPGEEGQITYSINPEGSKLNWTSSNPRIADVDENGYITTIPELDQTTTVTITAETRDGSLKKAATVTVLVEGTEASDPDPNHQANLITAYDTSLEANTGKDLQVQVNGSPDEVTVEFSSSNNDVLVVEEDGYIRGISPGTAKVTITATNHRSKQTQTVTVTVTVTGGSGTDPVPNEGDHTTDRNGDQNGGYGTRD